MVELVKENYLKLLPEPTQFGNIHIPKSKR